MLLCCALKTDKLTAGHVNRPLDLDDNFNLSLLSRRAVTITSKKLHPVMKVGGDQVVVLVPRLSIFGGDALHGSHRVVAPMNRLKVTLK